MKTFDEALSQSSETHDVDFKSHFVPSVPGEMLEVVKDIVAMANSGGGFILFGVTDAGVAVPSDETRHLDLDPAIITDQVHKYTDVHFSAFEIAEGKIKGVPISVLSIGPCEYPIIFGKTGNYQSEGGRQKNAFQGGTLYFRHGAKSEPGTYDDLRCFFDRKIDAFRKQWMEGIARVVEAPPGASVQIVSSHIRHSVSEDAQPIRLTSDPSAPAYYAISIDETHPFRRKDLIPEIRKHVVGELSITPFQVDCARKELGLDLDKRYVFRLVHASPQYSKECVQLLVSKYLQDPSFFAKVADKHRKNKKLSETLPEKSA